MPQAARLLVAYDKKCDGIAAAGIGNRVRYVGLITGRIRPVELNSFVTGRYGQSALLQCQELPRALKMSCTFQSCAGFQFEFIELDIFFQMQRRQGPNSTVLVRTVMIFPVVCPDDVNARAGSGRVNQIPQRDSKCLSNPCGHGERWVGLIAFNLAEHRFRDTTGCG